MSNIVVNMHHVIIGSGAAGCSAVEAIRQIDRESRITVISKDEHPYTPVFLAKYLSGEIEESQLYYRGVNFFKELNVTHIKGEVVEVDETVKLKNGQEIDFDRLLISTGSKPFVPPIKGVEKKGIFTFQTLDDVRKIIEHSKNSRRCAVIGAGPIGLEAAHALLKLGMEVRVFEALDRILPTVVDEEISQMVHQEFESMGMDIKTGDRVEEFKGEERLESIVAGGEEHETDLAIISTGVRPNLDFVKGIEIGTGIIVNRRMETSKENVYAAGDVTEAEDAFGEPALIQTWTNAVTQGRVAGKNMAGVETYHEGSVRVNVIKDCNVPVLSVGHSSATLGDDFEVEVFKGDGIFRKAFFREDMLVGFQSAGSAQDLRLSALIQFLIRKRIRVRNRKFFVRRPHSFWKFSDLRLLKL